MGRPPIYWNSSVNLAVNNGTLEIRVSLNLLMSRKSNAKHHTFFRNRHSSTYLFQYS